MCKTFKKLGFVSLEAVESIQKQYACQKQLIHQQYALRFAKNNLFAIMAGFVNFSIFFARSIFNFVANIDREIKINCAHSTDRAQKVNRSRYWV